MGYREHLPDPHLSSAVRTFWHMTADPSRDLEEHRSLPEQTARLIFFTGASYQGLLDGPLEVVPGAVLLGLGLTPQRLVSHGQTRALMVELYPWSARQLFGWGLGLPAVDLTRAAPRVAHTVCGLLGLDDWGGAQQVVETWLLALLAEREREPGAAVDAATRLYRSNGTVRIASLADELNLSPRQLERQFHQEIGVNAKTLGRLIRFGEVYTRLQHRPEESLAGLAYDLGFADQAHLTREFRALAQMTPREFALIARQRRGLPQPDGELEPAVGLWTPE